MGDLNENTAPSEPLGASTIALSSSLDDFQTREQGQVLDTVAQIRKCGLDALLPLPQIVVCGNQSSGKSSVLEALTEVPFPRSDNLCTRFATEITLRRAPLECIRLAVIPDDNRTSSEKSSMNAFSETITDFAQLPAIMEKATAAMGIVADSGNNSAPTVTRAFAKDVLRFEIEGPNRPQLTVVDVPGLIQNATKGVSEKDTEIVAEITDFYIQQSRTICLAVIQATDDYANQPILTRVREVDREGNRTLGVITKPDRLDPGSGTEGAFVALARNEDVFFKLGWHVVKNRKFQETNFSVEERNESEARFFQKTVWNTLPADCLGIDTLRTRLSGLLFEHVKRELPKLRQDLETALTETTDKLNLLGHQRASVQECRNYLTNLSLKCLEITKAAIDGHYEPAFFQTRAASTLDFTSAENVTRLRAAIQSVNHEYASKMRIKGPKYFIKHRDQHLEGKNLENYPNVISHDEALKWVSEVLIRSRGKEPIGNYNPLVIGELFWELSSKWQELAEDHIELVARMCTMFMDTLLAEIAPRDVRTRLTELKIKESLRNRKDCAIAELQRLNEDRQDFPVAYNHYYTDNVQKNRHSRIEKSFRKSIEAATVYHVSDNNTKDIDFGDGGNHYDGNNGNGYDPGQVSVDNSGTINIGAAVHHFRGQVDRDMVKYSCEEALDCLLSMYKVQQKTFVANVTSQVIERHLIRGLNMIFSPLDVNGLSDDDVLKVASEPASTKRQRDFLSDRQTKLLSGKEIFREIMGRIQ